MQATQDKQKALWRDLILKYCRQQRIYQLSTDADDDCPLFHNPAIKSVAWNTVLLLAASMQLCIETGRLTKEAKTLFLEDVVKHGVCHNMACAVCQIVFTYLLICQAGRSGWTGNAVAAWCYGRRTTNGQPYYAAGLRARAYLTRWCCWTTCTAARTCLALVCVVVRSSLVVTHDTPPQNCRALTD